jgi:AraC family transcriptional regulator, regulatory protein of adaptative response / DNA-3-methyladenine glycosylase II
VDLDHDRCYAIVESRDRRFDGWFVGAVSTTRIYCRPSCPARTPKRTNIGFFRTAAAAQLAGYRACKRCLPDAVPGSPEWNSRADVSARAMRLIADGVIDREGVGGLAKRLGYSERQLQRLLVDETGAAPLALARAQRAHTARVLIETTVMPFGDVAFAAGFSSIRQFNDTIREVYADSPTRLRELRRMSGGVGVTRHVVRLAYRQPFHAESLFGFLGERAVPGIESWDGTTYARSLRLPRAPGVVELTPRDGWIDCALHLCDPSDTQAAVQRCRRLLDLDADVEAVDATLAADASLARLVARRPGLRSPGHPDGTELLVRAVLGQQVSVKGARTLATRLVLSVDHALPAPVGAITHLFPSADAIAALSPDDFAMPRARGAALIGACAAIASRAISLDAGADRAAVAESLVALAGIGPWTAQYVAMRALNDPDVFMPTDLGVRHGLTSIGLDSSPRAATAHADRWRPWRSYAVHHLWAALADVSPTTPTEESKS